jgi:uncharacterized protein with PQ loop repeat
MEAVARSVARPKRGFAARGARMSAEVVGWAAVAILFATMSAQAWTEWRDRVKKGINPYFFVGQVAASVAFITYSAMVGNTVFVVGNALVLAAALAGGAILIWNKKKR